MIYSVTPDITGSYYDLSAHLTLLVFFLMLCYEGHRRKFPAAAWLLSLAIVVTLALFGSRIGVFDLAAWQTWWQGGAFPVATERTSIGVVLFLFPAIWLIRKGLRFNAPILDTLAFAIPVVLIIRRMGCIAAACCYGIPTESSWGLRYLGPSSIRDQHWVEVISGADRFGSAAVHPVPVYFILGGVISLFLLRKYQNRFKQAGSLTLFALALLLGFRFFIEFFRDPATNHQLGNFVLGLKQIQWFSLLAVLVLTVSIWIRERRPQTYFTKAEMTVPSLARIGFVNLLLFTFVYWMQSSFTLAEKIGIHSFLILSGVALLAEVLKEKDSLASFNWQSSFAALLAFFMMSQSYPSNMDKIEKGTKHTLSLDYNRAHLGSSTYECIDIESGCGGNTCVFADSLRPNGPRYNQFNLGYNAKVFRTRLKRWGRNRGKSHNTYYTYGVNYQPEFFYDKETDYRVHRSNIMPYVGRGGKNFEFIIGLRMGKIWGNDISGDGLPTQKSRVLSTALRIGSPDNIYINFGAENSTALGASVNNTSLSLTMNMRDYSSNYLEYMRFGLANIYENAGLIYIEPALNLNDHFLITPRFGLSFRPELDSENRAAFNHFFIGLGAQYRIN